MRCNQRRCRSCLSILMLQPAALPLKLLHILSPSARTTHIVKLDMFESLRKQDDVHSNLLIEYVGPTDAIDARPDTIRIPDWAAMSDSEVYQLLEDMDKQCDSFLPRLGPRSFGEDLPHKVKKQEPKETPKEASKSAQQASAKQASAKQCNAAPDKPTSPMDELWKEFDQFAINFQEAPWRSSASTMPPSPRNQSSNRPAAAFQGIGQVTAAAAPAPRQQYDPLTQQILDLRDKKLSGKSEITSSDNIAEPNTAQQNHQGARPSMPVPHPQYPPPPKARPPVPHPQHPPRTNVANDMTADDVHEMLMYGSLDARKRTRPESSESSRTPAKGTPSKWGHGKRSKEGRHRPRGGLRNPNTQWMTGATMARKKGPVTYFRFRYLFPKPSPTEVEHWRGWKKWFDEQGVWPSDAMFRNGQWNMLLPPLWRDHVFRNCKDYESFFAVICDNLKIHANDIWWDGLCWRYQGQKEDHHSWNDSSWHDASWWDSWRDTSWDSYEWQRGVLP